MNVGLGYDIHRLVPGRRLILGGVDIAHSLGLQGHSDADVVLHAIMDALLGAAGLGDIGCYFPNNDERWRDTSSLSLLNEVVRMLSEHGWQTGNVDATVVAEAPKIQPRVDEMRHVIARALGVEPSHVNIKATTAEGTGAEGRHEAISAFAVALLTRQ